MIKQPKNGDTIENTIYEHRVLKRISQSELANAVDVSKQTIYVMEKGNYTPSIMLAYRLSDFFAVPVTELFIYKKEK